MTDPESTDRAARWVMNSGSAEAGSSDLLVERSSHSARLASSQICLHSIEILLKSLSVNGGASGWITSQAKEVKRCFAEWITSLEADWPGDEEASGDEKALRRSIASLQLLKTVCEETLNRAAHAQGGMSTQDTDLQSKSISDFISQASDQITALACPAVEHTEAAPEGQTNAPHTSDAKTPP